PDSRTFRCDRCGQVLKVPDGVASPRTPSPGGSQPDPSARGEGAAAPAPPPRRGGSAASLGPSVSATATATLPAVDGDDAGPPSRRGRDQRSSPAPTPAPRKVRWWWRLLAWIVAVPLGLLLTGWPALQLDLLKKDDLLDVFVGEGAGRYTRLLIFAAVWALVTALLVQLFIDGGRWFAARRRARAR
ncbi:MAG TPA: hypothetical protein VFZ17_11215, partial [Acidimicrobiia bacterium]|nr:hypothetical protein [Acidimicrobiia bacterium]